MSKRKKRIIVIGIILVVIIALGIGAWFLIGRIGAASPQVGLSYNLDTITAVVIGGTPFTGGRANVAGSILGALCMQTLTTTILTRGVPVEYTLVVKAVVVVAVCLLQSGQFRGALRRMVSRYCLLHLWIRALR